MPKDDLVYVGHMLDMAEKAIGFTRGVNISQIVTLDKSQLRARIGTLSPERVGEVLRGIDLILQPREVAS